MEPVAQMALTNVDVAVALQLAAAKADFAGMRSAVAAIHSGYRHSDSVIIQSIALLTRTVATRG